MGVRKILQKNFAKENFAKFFFKSEHVSSQIWCQNFFPLLGGGGGGPSEIFFLQSEHVSSQIWCQKFFPLLGGGGCPSVKIFFPV